ncbi:MAG: small multi-drug export protein [Thermoplasmata archaeon]
MQSKESEIANENVSIEFRRRGLELAGWTAGFVFLFFIIPGIVIIALPPTQRPEGLAVLAAVPLIEYLAISVGIGLGINPILSFLLTMLPCTGLCMLVLGLFGFMSDSSQRAKRFLEKIQKKIEKYPRLKKYGVASNFLFIIILGVYIAPGISILLGWSRVRSVVFMAGGISFITFLIGLGTIGIIDLFFV